MREFTAVLISLLFLANISAFEHWTIVPDKETSSKCPLLNSCITLDDFANSALTHVNTTLSFLPGEHLLSKPIAVTGAVEMIMIGHPINHSRCDAKIRCQQTNVFIFQNIQAVKISGLEFSGCINDFKNGGALYLKNVNSLSIVNCRFTNNRVSGGLVFGGAVYIHTVSHVSIDSSYFTNNSALSQCNHTASEVCNQFISGGGALHLYNSKVTVRFSYFYQNTAHTNGGAILSLQNTELSVHDTDFFSNNVESGYGGAIFAGFGILSLSKDNFTNNRAGSNGGAISAKQTLVDSSESIYENNSANISGGAVFVLGGHFRTSLSQYSSNTAVNGGAIYVKGLLLDMGSRCSNVSKSCSESSIDYANVVDNSLFHNSASRGGAIASLGCNITSYNSHFKYNTATDGGAIYLNESTLNTLGGLFTNNGASHDGGVICLNNGHVSSSLGQFRNNEAALLGAVIYVLNGSITTEDCLYSSNRAGSAGGVFSAIMNANIHSLRSNFTSNSAVVGGVISFLTSNVSTQYSSFVNNYAEYSGGAIFGNSTFINDTSNTYISNTAAIGGGAIGLFGGNMSCTNTLFRRNGAMNGGGAVFTLKSVVLISNSNFSSNTAGSSGGAIFASLCLITSSGGQFISNSAAYGGAVTVINGSITISECVAFHNQAGVSGGAIFLNSTLALFSEGQFIYNNATNGGVISGVASSLTTTDCNFSHNRASDGGGAVFMVSGLILNSNRNTFTNNSATSGGAIYAYKTSVNTLHSNYTSNIGDVGGSLACFCYESNLHVFIINNYYTNNSGGTSGGALASFNCSITDFDSYYVSNFIGGVGSGGALVIFSGTINISGAVYINNFATSAGGAIDTEDTSVSISHTQFMLNEADFGGALRHNQFSKASNSLLIFDTNFTNNSANDGGALAIDKGHSVSCSHCYFERNTASLGGGGAVSIENGNVVTANCYFSQNIAKYLGGAVAVHQANFSISNSLCDNNVAGKLGGAIYIDYGSISTSSCRFTNNVGGAIHFGEGFMLSSNCLYENNTAEMGGALVMAKGNILISNGHFLSNSASNFGGAIYLLNSSKVSCEYCSFISNTASYGGACFGFQDNFISSSGCQFKNNKATGFAGAIGSFGGNITSFNTSYVNNVGHYFGGALFVYRGKVISRNTNFSDNSVLIAGGAIGALMTDIYNSNSNYSNNHADVAGGAIFLAACINLTQSLNQTGPGIIDQLPTSESESLPVLCSFIQSTIPVKLTSRNSNLRFFNTTFFKNNTCGLLGGGLVGFRSGINISGTVVIKGNAASNGSGLALMYCTLNMHSPVIIINNKANVSGGGIFAYQSKIIFDSQPYNKLMTISNNTASETGGGLHAIDSFVQIVSGRVHFENNSAKLGGAIYLEQNSKLHLIKKEQEVFPNQKIRLAQNSAQYGGAIYVADKSANKLACEEGVPGIVQGYIQECFIQTELLSLQSNQSFVANFINVFFIDNTASESGDDIYGGLLDRCVLNPSAELAKVFPEHVTFTGVDYIKVATEFDGLVDYDNLTFSRNPLKLINAIKASDFESIVSSEPLQVCFCLDNVPNCSFHHQSVLTKEGQLFHLSVVAVDQVGNPVEATVTSSFITNNSHLNIDQAKQNTFAQCTDLEYNVYSRGDFETTQLELYADGPCTDIGISKRVLDVIFLLCTCPVGFHPVETETLCRCECDPKLRPYILSCSYENETILLDTNAWIDYVNISTGSGYIIHDVCSFDYCVQEPVNVNLNVPNGADMQCAFNRSGKLCGACKENLSLVMSTSRCRECSGKFIFLLIPFAFAGIALVAFILILNITVATGTLYGLIFYANMIAASRLTFLPSDNLLVLNIFVSWINLDFGIETCFYDGMDSYAKVLLQLAFPVYILLISIVIIIISEHSVRFAMILGRKDPVATLSTLILLSYSKLIRIIIACLQYVYLDYPDGSREIVWLYDANVPYFKVSHIPRFVIASVIIILGSVYTVLLLFGQWIPRCNNRLFRWANNPKYNAFIIKYHAPFNPKHRYWMGLLLFVRIVHYVVAPFVSQSAVLLSVSCIVLCLLVFKVVLSQKTYKNWSLNTLENLFLLNLGIFAAVTYYLSQDKEANQTAVAGVSLSFAFLMFVGILIYHFYTYILKNTQLWMKITQLVEQMRNRRDRRPLYEPLPEVHQDEGENVNEELEMQPLHPNVINEPIDLPPDYEPPIITPAVRYSQERRELEVLDPITENDYRQINRRPAPRPRQVPTSTVIDIIRHGQEDTDSDD